VNPVVVSRHAVLRAHARGHHDGLPACELTARIQAEVADALAAGRVSNCKPVWVQLYSRGELRSRKRPRPLQLEGDQRFVWDEAELHGWVIVREPDRDVVVTAMQRVRARPLETEVCAWMR